MVRPQLRYEQHRRCASSPLDRGKAGCYKLAPVAPAPGSTSARHARHLYRGTDGNRRRELRTRKGATPSPLVPVGFLLPKSRWPAVRCCAQSALTRDCRLPLSLMIPRASRVKCDCGANTLPVTGLRARSSLTTRSVNLARVTPARPSGARCVVTSPGRALTRPGQPANLSRCATGLSLSIRLEERRRSYVS